MKSNSPRVPTFDAGNKPPLRGVGKRESLLSARLDPANTGTCTLCRMFIFAGRTTYSKTQAVARLKTDTTGETASRAAFFIVADITGRPPSG